MALIIGLAACLHCERAHFHAATLSVWHPIYPDRLFGVLSALVMTLALNGGMLFVFDQLTHDTQTPTTVVSLESVTIVGKRV